MGVARLGLGQPFDFPTANHALYEKGGEDRFFAPVPGKTWVSGTFGCVRTDGHQMHEGLDIRCLQRDRHGEPTDPVMATADGTVAYVNNKPSLSNYGRYIVLQHVVEGMEVYSLYAHLSEARADLKPGKAVKRGEQIGVMGRTSNTRERIGKDRPHVHFELNLFYNERFDAWYRRHFPGERNDHGIWNGENLVGMDARLILLAERDEGPKFSLLSWVRGRTELCRVQVRKTDCSWLRRYPMLVKPNPSAAEARRRATKSLWTTMDCPSDGFADGVRDERIGPIRIGFRERRRGGAQPLPTAGGPTWFRVGTGGARAVPVGIVDRIRISHSHGVGFLPARDRHPARSF